MLNKSMYDDFHSVYMICIEMLEAVALMYTGMYIFGTLGLLTINYAYSF